MNFPILCCILFLLCSCSSEDPQNKQEKEPSPPQPLICVDCHPFELDSAHKDISCTTCHAGKEQVLSAEDAHENIIKSPAHPQYMEQMCGTCHIKQVERTQQSLHYTLQNETNIIRRAFGAERDLESLQDIPQVEEVGSSLDLVDDLLRRRCLRCHLYYQGDSYPETRHGTGCASCHLDFSGGSLKNHAFKRLVPDSQCLHCHQGNFVGADYYGRFEHDHHWDYRTPFLKDGSTKRPYGIESHQLAPDVHQQAGLACIDCHQEEHRPESGTPSLTCSSCHLWQGGDPLPTKNLSATNGHLVLTTAFSGKKITVPRAKHAAHEQYKNTVSCAVCHAQWSFTDEGTHLLRLDVEEYDPWGALYVQGSDEVEKQIYASLYGDESYPYVYMRDKITGELYSGIWLKGFELRRWEFPITCRDDQGMLHICRPLLDLHLSYVNEKEELVFDAITPGNAPPSGLLPYTPHTVGKAGAFFTERLQENSDMLNYPLNLKK